MEQGSCKLERYVLARHHIPTQKWPIRQLIVFWWWDWPPWHRVTENSHSDLLQQNLLQIGRKLQTLFHSKTFQTKTLRCSFGCSVACICQGFLVFLVVMVLLSASHMLIPPYAHTGQMAVMFWAIKAFYQANPGVKKVFFGPADRAGVFSRWMRLSHCEAVSQPCNLADRCRWFFQTLALWTNASTNGDGCAECMPRPACLPQTGCKTLLWVSNLPSSAALSSETSR